MNNDLEYKPPRRRPTGFAFLFAILGLLMLNLAVGLLITGKTQGVAWILIAAGVGCVLAAVFWAKKSDR